MPWFTQQSISKLNPIPHKKRSHTGSRGIHPKFTRMVQHMQTNQCDTPHKQKTKNYMVISRGAGKACDKIQHPIMIKILVKVGTEETYLKTIEVIYDEPTENVITVVKS